MLGVQGDQRSPHTGHSTEAAPASPCLEGRTKRAEALERVSESLHVLLAEVLLYPFLFCLAPLSFPSCSYLHASGREDCRGPIG